jgi:hypothetical protein
MKERPLQKVEAGFGCASGSTALQSFAPGYGDYIENN